MDADKSRPVHRPPTTGGADRVQIRRPRSLARPDLPVGPQRDVRDLLYDLHEQAGKPALADLEERIAGDDRLEGAPKKDLIHKIISQGGPAGHDDIRAVARMLARACGKDEYAVAVQVVQLAEPPGQPTSLTGAQRPRAGRLVADCDPLVLEVHQAIYVPGAGTDPLPAYVPRVHDTQLRAAVDELLTGGVSRLVTVVGESSTGKTRACWELVQYLEQRQPGRWRVWHPYDPTRPDAALAGMDRVGPYTIIWLNEAQLYLAPTDAGLGERIAAALRTLLHDPDRGPVLALATMWPQHWNTLMFRPDPQHPDPNAQARDVLARSMVSVAGGFTPHELVGLGDSGVDPRVLHAAKHAEGGRITQYLAGAPELINRYRTAPPAARAIIEVAMDARRLGHPPALPRGLLERAAPGYLDDHDWDHVGEDWLEEALSYTARPCMGARGPLTRIRARIGDPNVDNGQPCYRLADYLEQIGRQERAAVYPPESLWTTFAANINNPVLSRHLGGQAFDRGRYQHAVWLYTRAASHIDTEALTLLARLREEAGDAVGAAAVAIQAANCGDTDTLWDLVELREQRGDTSGAQALCQMAADCDNASVLRVLARRREHAGDRAGAEALAVQAAERGDTTALCDLADLRERAWDRVGARALYQQAADLGDTAALRVLARWLEHAGDHTGANALALQAADRGDTVALRDLIELRLRVGNGASVQALFQQIADRGGPVGTRAAGVKAAYGGDPAALPAPIRRPEIAASRASAQVADRVDHAGLQALIRLREESGDRADAETLAVQAADRGDTQALRALARLREESGDRAGAYALAMQAANRGDTAAQRALVRMHTPVGDLDRTKTMWVFAGRFGTVSLEFLAELRERSGDADGANRLRRFGLTGEGEPARGLDFRSGSWDT